MPVTNPFQPAYVSGQNLSNRRAAPLDPENRAQGIASYISALAASEPK
jgi:hypothetical protein